MYKKIIFFLLFPIFLSAQSNFSDSTSTYDLNKRLYRSGVHMKKYASQMGVGTGLIILGGGGAVIAAYNDSKEGAVIAGAFGAIGLILQLTAPRHLKNAGKVLQEGRIVIPLNKQKR